MKLALLALLAVSVYASSFEQELASVRDSVISQTPRFRLRRAGAIGSSFICADREGIRGHNPVSSRAIENLTHLECPDLRGADLTGRSMIYANLQGADLTGARLARADLFVAHLRGAAMKNAELSDASLLGTRIMYADLTGADLRRANLRMADLTNAKLSGALLEGALFDDGTRLPFPRQEALARGMIHRPQ